MMFITIYGLNSMKMVEDDTTINYPIDSLSAHCIDSSTINTPKMHVPSELKS